MQQQKYRKKGYQPNIYLREWAIKTELRYRARIYDPLEHEHKAIEKYEQDHQQTTGSTSDAANRDERDEERERQDAENIEKDTRDEGEDEENKSSLAHISNQMVMSIGIIPRERLSLNKFITVLSLLRRTRRYFGSSST